MPELLSNIIDGGGIPEVPSTRDSLRYWDRYVPINKTLATPGTAEDLWAYANYANAGPSVNVVTNPGFETDWTSPTTFVDAGAAGTRVTTAPRTGTYHALINPANSATYEGIYYTLPVIQANGNRSVYVCASCWIRGASASGDAALTITTSAGLASTLASSATTSLTTSYQRLKAVYAMPAGTTGSNYRVYITTVAQHNIDMYADDFQVEYRADSNVTDFIDAGSNNLNTRWHGTANASYSQREKPMRKIRGLDLHFSLDTYVAFDNTANSTNGIYIKANTTWSPNWSILADRNMSFINVNVGEAPVVRGTLWGVSE